MEFCVGIAPETGLKKSIDDMRFRYDRNLVKERYPHICVYGPVAEYINIKKLGSSFKEYLRKRKRFRLSTDMVSFLEKENLVFLNIFHKGEMQEIFRYLQDELALDPEPYYFPHIVLAKNHSHGELSQIYEELHGYNFEFDFMADSFTFYVKEDRHWEEQLTINI